MEQQQLLAENLQQRELTPGERAVGLTFNPGGNAMVDTIKRKYAEIIDLLEGFRQTSPTPGAARHASIAITDAETAQMRAVKAVTFPY